MSQRVNASEMHLICLCETWSVGICSHQVPITSVKLRTLYLLPHAHMQTLTHATITNTHTPNMHMHYSTLHTHYRYTVEQQEIIISGVTKLRPGPGCQHTTILLKRSRYSNRAVNNSNKAVTVFREAV